MSHGLHAGGRFALLLVAGLFCWPGQPLAAPSAGDVETLIRRLAAPELDGRRAGTPGGERAVALLERELAALGLAPLEGFSGLRQEFEFHPRSTVTGETLRLAGAAQPLDPADWQALAASGAGRLTAPAVFCGYGLRDAAAGWLEYEPADVAGRVVLLLRQVPEGLAAGSSPQAQTLARRVAAVRECGARAVLVVDSPFDLQAARLRGEGPDPALGDLGLPVAGLSAAWADSLLQRAGSGLKTQLSRLSRAKRAQPALPLVGELELSIRVERETARSWNLGAALPGTGAAARRWVLVGAHHDHLGRGADGRGPLHPGADDNASGTALLLQLARDLRDSPVEPAGGRRSLALVWFGGEELGRLGSRRLAEESPAWLDSLDLMINLDMLGRLEEQTLLLLGGAEHPELQPGLGAAAAAAGLLVRATGESPGGDHESFRALGLPAVMLFTGAHEDYHKPTDTAERIHVAGLEPIRRTLAGWLPAVLDSGLRIAAGQPAAAVPEGGSPVRVAIGIVPGYESREGGMPVQDVKPGSAAERAGLRAGDVLLALGRFPVANIHDYTFALRHYEAGEELPVAYLRDGQRRQTTVRLEERIRP
ncbi:MAG: M28 family peptidase [Candidatus Delongbacteria bacterium]